MATTETYSGSADIAFRAAAAFTGDQSGSQSASSTITLAYAASGGDAPTISGFIKGTLTVASAADIELAHATDPFLTFGDAEYSSGFAATGSKLKTLIIRNTGTTGSCVISRTATTGLPIFQADGDAVNLDPGDIFVFHKKTGTAALTNDTNDHLTLTPTGTATLELMAIYGP